MLQVLGWSFFFVVTFGAVVTLSRALKEMHDGN